MIDQTITSKDEAKRELEKLKECAFLTPKVHQALDIIENLVNEQNIEQIKEKLLEKFKEHCYPVTQKDNSIEDGMTLTGITQVLNEVFSNIESLDNEWVDVRDRLPSEDETVLVNTDDGDIRVARRRYNTPLGNIAKEEWVWITSSGYYRPDSIIAWKPLPKPYERKE